jgi:DnaK suppressor protein
MDRAFLAEMETYLTARAAQLRTMVQQMHAASAPVAPDNAIGRLTRVDAMQATTMRATMARDHENELRLVERALRALDEGEYGCCRRCGEPIPETRLRARPEALFCVPCADARR